MPQRFDYDRLAPEQLAERLVGLDLLPNAFARVWGVRENTMNKWLTEGNIPPWVNVALDVLAEVPGALAAARRSAGRIIRRDNLRQLSYPYRKDAA